MNQRIALLFAVALAGCSGSTEPKASKEEGAEQRGYSVMDLLTKGDPQTCLHGDLLRDVIVKLAPDNPNSNFDQGEWKARAAEIPYIAEISMAGFDSSIKEMRCEGNMHIGEGSWPIAYRLRPGADGNSYVFWIDDLSMGMLIPWLQATAASLQGDKPEAESPESAKTSLAPVERKNVGIDTTKREPTDEEYLQGRDPFPDEDE